MKFRLTRIDNQWVEGHRELYDFLRSRKDGEYNVEVRKAGAFPRNKRAKVHIWMGQIERATGTTIEQMKRVYCESIGHMESKEIVTPGGEISKVFQRRSTEELDNEQYDGFLDYVQANGDFIGLRLE